MGLFDRQFKDILFLLQQMQEEGKITESIHRKGAEWPIAGDRDIILGTDTAVELGNPKDGSMAFLIWANEPERFKNRRISVLGPDLQELKGKRVPFGKIVLVGGDDFNKENSYERYRKLENVRYEICLKGYMMRGVSQYGREWSRVSQTAIDEGFSLQILGGALIERYLEIKFVRTVEVVFFTSGLKDMKPFLPIAETVFKIIGAMNKMIEDVSYDCSTCEYSDVCEDVEGLRTMRRTSHERGNTAGA